MNALAKSVCLEPEPTVEISQWLTPDCIAHHLTNKSAQHRVEWALDNLPGRPVLTSSFGAQSAVMLHMLTQVQSDIPVIVIDTGYLFPETYHFIDQLHERLHLNLKVYRAEMSSAWQESRYGKLWDQTGDQKVSGLNHYNRINKVEPMRSALKNLQTGVWFNGLRRQQSQSRIQTPFAQYRQAKDGLQDHWKVHPIADWTDRDVGMYLKAHDLPYHPLWEQGYVSIGDTHTTQRLTDNMRAEDTRFFGLHRECGIHTEI